MGLNAKKAPGGNKLDPMEAGTYPARLVQLLDFGLQPQRPFNGEERKPAREIGITYEFSDEFQKDEDGNDVEDKPRWLSETLPFYNLENEKANSTKRYHAFDPEEEYEGNWNLLLGMPALVTVVLNPGKGKNANRIFENVSGVTPMRQKDADVCPQLVNEARFFDMDDPNMEMFVKLPQWIRDKMTSNLEYEGSVLQRLVKTLPKEEAAPAKEDLDGDEVPY